MMRFLGEKTKISDYTDFQKKITQIFLNFNAFLIRVINP